MSEERMKEKCPSCGGVKWKYGDGVYKCGFCGDDYTREELESRALERSGRVQKLIAGFEAQMAQLRARTDGFDSAIAALSERFEEELEGVKRGASGGADEMALARIEQEMKAEVRDLRAFMEAGTSVYERNKHSVLEISAVKGDKSYAGAGFLITADGYAVTNAHVVVHQESFAPASSIRVCLPGGEYVKAEIVALGDDRAGYGDGVDLALIKLERVPAGGKPVTLGDYDKLQVGQRAYVIGNPYGEGTSLTAGVVNDLCRTTQDYGKTLMTDAAINGGNSGGGVFCASGELIGVTVASRKPKEDRRIEGMHYILPLPTLKRFLESVKGVRLS